MRLVMTMVVRDEADVLDANLAFHLSAGVDFVIVTNHRSRDGTEAILDRYARDGVLRVVDEPLEEYREAAWRTHMAQLAATEHDADWVVGADADEFWWPREGNLKTVLGAVPPAFGIVRGVWRPFVPRPDDGRSFAERMTARVFSHPDAVGPFRPQVKVAHRADPVVEVQPGYHDVVSSLAPVRSWFPFEVMHFPIRSRSQCANKYANWRSVEQVDRSLPRRRYADADAAATGAERSYHDDLAFDDDELRTGIAAGEVEVDTRLRDALRALRDEDGELRWHGRSFDAPRRTLALEASVARDAEVADARDSALRLHERLLRLQREVACIDEDRHLMKRLAGRTVAT